MTSEYVKFLFNYYNGELFWKTPKARRVKVGSIAGSIDDEGYKRVSIDGKSYKIHRLVFLYHFDYLPEEVDHIDGNKLNNLIENLRGVSKTQNQWNSRKPKTNKSGIKGVSWSKSAKKWQTGITINGKKCFRKYFDDLNEAKTYIELMRKQNHGEYARNE